MNKEAIFEQVVSRLEEHYHRSANILRDPARRELFNLFLESRRLDYEIPDDAVRGALSERIPHPGPKLLGLLRDFSIMWNAWHYCSSRCAIGLEQLLAANSPQLFERLER